jgi:hypothetical protein
MVASLVLLPEIAAATPEAARTEGVATCASSTCHGRALPVETGIILRNEYVTWSSFDPHARAYATLLSARSREIARRLGLPNAHEAAECLDCHTHNVAGEARGPRFQLDDGIGCEACHGAAGRWLGSHYDTPRVTREDNLARGMLALEEPAVRAAVCLGCHAGAEGNRFVTHRVMAAGHPRLGFELDTFTELWRTSGGREHYRRDADYAGRKATPEPLATWSAGLVSQARQYLVLLRTRYATHGPLPDFALFNCYSCHRAMGLADWQQRQPAAGAEPGSLRFDDSTLLALQAVLAGRPSLDPGLAGELGAAIADLQRATTGASAGLAPALDSLEAALDQVERAFVAAPLGRAEAGLVLGELVRRATRGDFPDYVHAEQVAMGLVILLDATEAARSVEVEALFRTLEDDERYDPARFRQALQQVH